MTQNVLILDFGNAFLKAVSTQSRYPFVIPSCIHKLTSAQLRESLDPDEKSPLIRYNENSYFVGSNAQLYGGINNWGSEKLANVLMGVMAVIDRSQKIDQLVVCVPDKSINISLSHLVGLHSYERNSKQIQLNIADIEIVDETYGVWYGAQQLYRTPDGVNLALTIGAGTVNVTFYSGQGRVLHRAVTKKGMSSIASAISSELKSIHNLPQNPKLANIMASMADKKCIESGKYTLSGSGIDFTESLHRAIAAWKGELSAFVIETSSALDLDYWQFAIAGAGASYLSSGKATVIPPHPQTFAIESLLSLYEA